MSIDLLHILPLYAPRGRRMSVARDHFGSALVSDILYPPIEVASAAGLLRSRGFRIAIFPADALRLSHDEVVRRARALDPAHIHVPLTYPSYAEDVRLLRLLRQALPSTRILVTGPNVTHRPEALLTPDDVGGRGTGGGCAERPLADEVIQGEIEPGLLDALTHPDEMGRPNRARLQDGRLVVGPRKPYDDLSFMEVPARDLLPRHGYHLPFAVASPSTYLETSRGCVYGCSFCVATTIIYQNRMRFRPMELVFRDLDAIDALGFRDVTLKDLTFTVNRSRVVAFCERVLERGYRFGWRCFSTVDRVDAELLRLMKRAGCYQICYGFESGNDEVLAGTGKGTTVAQGRRAAHLTAEAGIEVAGTFILGLPGDTLETMEQTVRLALDEPVALAQFTPCVLVPGTPAARARGIGDAALEASGDPFASSENGAGLPSQVLSEYLRRANRRFYLRPHILAGRIRSLRSWTQLRIQLAAGVGVVRRMAGR